MITRRRKPEPPPSKPATPGHPHLAPPGWSIGRPLSEIIAQRPLTTAETTAAALAVLSGLGELHRSGKCHGNVGVDTVGIGLDGWIRLSAERAETSAEGAATDIADAGRLLCRLLEVPERPEGGRTVDGERSAFALVAVARKLAEGAPWSADDAWAAVHDAAGYSGTEPQLVKALAELRERAAGRTEVERAVTRVVVGVPLATAPAAAPPKRGRSLPALRLPRRRGVLPSLDRPAALPRPQLPKLQLPRPQLHRPQVPKPQLPSWQPPQVRLPRWHLPNGAGTWAVLLVILALLGGVLGGAAGMLSKRATPVRASAVAPQRPASRAPVPASLEASTPSAAVSKFFQLVQQQKLGQAALLWKPKMSSAVDLQTRFGGVRSVQLRRDDIAAEDDGAGIATVAVDWVETDSDGSTHEYAGYIFTDTGPYLWRWDSWRVNEVTQPSGGDNGSGDGGGG